MEEAKTQLLDEKPEERLQLHQQYFGL